MDRKLMEKRREYWMYWANAGDTELDGLEQELETMKPEELHHWKEYVMTDDEKGYVPAPAFDTVMKIINRVAGVQEKRPEWEKDT